MKTKADWKDNRKKTEKNKKITTVWKYNKIQTKKNEKKHENRTEWKIQQNQNRTKWKYKKNTPERKQRNESRIKNINLTERPRAGRKTLQQR